MNDVSRQLEAINGAGDFDSVKSRVPVGAAVDLNVQLFTGKVGGAGANTVVTVPRNAAGCSA